MPSVDPKRIVRGRQARPPRVLIYGFDGVGKTTFAAGAPDPLFLDANRGSSGLDVARVDVKDLDDLIDWLTAIESGSVKCSTVVLDSMTDIEAMVHAKIFPNTTITRFEGGYGKGDDEVLKEFRPIVNRLERIWASGKAIVIVAHAMVKKFEDPTGPGFERFEIACSKKLAGLLRQTAADYVFFAREDVVIAKDKAGPTKATTTHARWVYTRRCPAYDAKARGSTAFPERFPLSWAEFESVVKNDAALVETLRADIDAMLAELADPALETQVRGYLKEFPQKMVEAHNRLSARMQEKKQKEESSDGAK